MLLQNGQVVVSERQVGPDTAAAAANDIETWLICDGNTDTLSNVPGSKSEEFVSKLPSPIKASYRMELFAVISSIFSEKEEGLSGDKHRGHPILHINLPKDPSLLSEYQWHCFNDFQVTIEAESEEAAKAKFTNTPLEQLGSYKFGSFYKTFRGIKLDEFDPRFYKDEDKVR